MPTSTRVLKLDDQRGKRERRLERALALLAPDDRRASLARHLVDLLEQIGGDRAVLAWLDEFEPSLPRAHVVIDLLCDRPRRRVDLDALIEAWDQGVPGVVDQPEARRGPRRVGGCRTVVSLGSDGIRAWFVLVEGSQARAALSAGLLDELAFRAGRLAGALLDPEADPADVTIPGFDLHRFDDMDDRELRTARMLIVRFLQVVRAEDLLLDPECLEDRLEHIRYNLAPWSDHEEFPVWGRILEEAEAQSIDGLLTATLDLDTRITDDGDIDCALEFRDFAYQFAVALGETAEAARIARSLGRGYRAAGLWTDSEMWYSTAVSLARLLDDAEAEAVALDGWANTLRVKGAFPSARRRLGDALDLARQADSPYAVGSVNQSLMTLSAQVGEYRESLEFGWAAVEAYRARRDQLRALVAVAGVLLDMGEAELGEQAYAVAVEHVEEPYFRLFALEGYAHAAALRADRGAWEARAARLDAEDWRVGGPDFESQVYLYRGRAEAGFGRDVSARRWLTRAMALAEEHRLSRTLFAAQDALARLGDGCAVVETPQPSTRLDLEMVNRVSDRLVAVDRRLAGIVD